VVTLVDHDVFKIIPAERVAGTRVVDTKGIWR
jgi:UDP-N-acetyl-D-mannosaminuronate dehydrogenase